MYPFRPRSRRRKIHPILVAATQMLGPEPATDPGAGKHHDGNLFSELTSLDGGQERKLQAALVLRSGKRRNGRNIRVCDPGSELADLCDRGHGAAVVLEIADWDLVQAGADYG